MGTLKEDLTQIKTVEDTLTSNKVANFAYTNTAYENNDAIGVDTYDYNKEQNIPTGTASVMKVNDTVLKKGYRAQASSVTRMLLNHFLGRLSYNLNKVNDNMSNLLETLQNHLGKANGIATLDDKGRVPYTQLPESAMEFKGTWNAETNTPTLVDGGGTNGDFYVVSVGGTQIFDGVEVTFLANDRIIYNSEIWTKLSGGSVRTVNSQEPDTSGNIAITGSNINVSGTDTTTINTKLSALDSSISSLDSSVVKTVNTLAPINNAVTLSGENLNTTSTSSITVASAIETLTEDISSLQETVGTLEDSTVKTVNSISPTDNNITLYGTDIKRSSTNSTTLTSAITSAESSLSSLKTTVNNLSNSAVKQVNGKSPSSNALTLYGTDIVTSSSDSSTIAEKIQTLVGSTMLGTHWKESEYSDYITYFTDIATNGSVWVGATSDSIYYSNNLADWNMSDIPTPLTVSLLHYSKKLKAFVALWKGYVNGFFYSTNGNAWTSLQDTSYAYTDITDAGDFLFVNSTSRGLKYATTKYGFSDTNLSTQTLLEAPKYNTGMYVVCTTSDSDDAGLYYSSNGTTWTRASNIGSGYYLNTDCPNCFVAYGSGGVWISTNSSASTGVNWSKLSATSTVTGVAYNSSTDTFVLTGSAGLYMINSSRVFSTVLSSFSSNVICKNGIFLGYVNSAVSYSHSGKTWVKVIDIDGSAPSCSYVNGTWLIIDKTSTYVCFTAKNLGSITYLDNRNSNFWNVNGEIKILYANGAWVVLQKYNSTNSVDGKLIYSKVQDLIDNGDFIV